MDVMRWCLDKQEEAKRQRVAETLRKEMKAAEATEPEPIEIPLPDTQPTIDGPMVVYDACCDLP